MYRSARSAAFFGNDDMTTFVSETEVQESAVSLHNDEFYPELSLAALSQQYRTNDTVSDHITAQQLQSAIYHINDQLTKWREGCTKPALSEVGDFYVWHYTNAVYTQAKAYLIRIYRDASATGIGHDRADGNDLSADNYERQSWQSLQKILGRPTTRVTLL